jgi:hypothetical protein
MILLSVTFTTCLLCLFSWWLVIDDARYFIQDRQTSFVSRLSLNAGELYAFPPISCEIKKTPSIDTLVSIYFSVMNNKPQKVEIRKPNSAGGLKSSNSNLLKQSKQSLSDFDELTEVPNADDAMYNYHLDRATFNEDGHYWAHKMNRGSRLGASERDYLEGSRLGENVNNALQRGLQDHHFPSRSMRFLSCHWRRR